MSKERYLSLKEVRERTGLGRTTIYSNMARGDFPSPLPTDSGADRLERIGHREVDRYPEAAKVW